MTGSKAVEWAVCGLLPLISGALLWAAGRAARAVRPLGQAPFTWRTSGRRLGWAPFAGVALLVTVYQLLART